MKAMAFLRNFIVGSFCGFWFVSRAASSFGTPFTMKHTKHGDRDLGTGSPARIGMGEGAGGKSQLGGSEMWKDLCVSYVVVFPLWIERYLLLWLLLLLLLLWPCNSSRRNLSPTLQPLSVPRTSVPYPRLEIPLPCIAVFGISCSTMDFCGLAVGS